MMRRVPGRSRFTTLHNSWQCGPCTRMPDISAARSVAHCSSLVATEAGPQATLAQSDFAPLIGSVANRVGGARAVESWPVGYRMLRSTGPAASTASCRVTRLHSFFATTIVNAPPLGASGYSPSYACKINKYLCKSQSRKTT